MILTFTNKNQWFYVPTNDNPADIACRPSTASELLETCWLDGPLFLSDPSFSLDSSGGSTPELLPEERSNLTCLHTLESANQTIFGRLFERTSSFSRMIRVVSLVLEFISKLRKKPAFKRDPRDTAILALVRHAQKERYSSTIEYLQAGKALPESCSVSKLSPSRQMFRHNQFQSIP